MVMLLPAEIESRVTIPILRALTAKKLIKEMKFTQEQVAKLLGVTQAAVSNYLRGVRGLSTDLEKNEQMGKYIDYIVDAITKNLPKEEIAKRMNEVLMDIRSQRILCQIHKKLEPDLDLDSCDICY